MIDIQNLGVTHNVANTREPKYEISKITDKTNLKNKKISKNFLNVLDLLNFVKHFTEVVISLK